MARRTPRMAAIPVVWWARRSRRPQCTCRRSSRHRWTCRYAASARTTALSHTAARRRRNRHGRAWRRPGAGPARADGRAGRDRDAQLRGLRAPQVPDLLRLRDRTRGRPADLRRSGRGQPADRLPVDAGVRRSPVCVGSARLPKRTRSNLSTTALRSLSSPRSPSSSVNARAPGSDTSSPRSDGRKHHSASALYDATGRVRAVADSLWVELQDPAAFGR